MDEQLRNLAIKVLQTVRPLVQEPNAQNTDFSDITLGILRNSFAALRDILLLSENLDTGNSALDLARKMIENMVSVDYMFLKGKEQMAHRFKEYISVQLHDEFEFLKSIGANFTQEEDERLQEINSDYAQLETQTKKDQSWAGRSTEGMLEDLYEKEKVSNFDFSRLGRAYIHGCQQNHLNPLTISLHGTEDSNAASSLQNLKEAHFCGAITLIRLSHRYIGEVSEINSARSHQEIAAELTRLFESMNAQT
jgi:flagellar motility protein MotE (MotC chaperone)